MKRNGFTLIELIVALGLAALFLPALVSVFSFSLRAANQGDTYSRAYAIAQEQMEAIYYLKAYDPNWLWLPDSPENNQGTDYYQPERVGGIWQLGPKTSVPLEENGYITTVQILPVYRNGVGGIETDPSFPPDPTSRQIVVQLTWKETGVPTQIQLISYVAAH